MNILLVDDHAVVRLGYAGLLRSGLPGVVVREAASGEEALARVHEAVPNLVIIGFGLPGISGLETTRRLRRRLPQLRVLFFSQHAELPLVRQALDAGASGYLTKSASPEVMLDAVARILDGHTYIEQDLATQLAYHPTDRRLQGMTQRELEIFLMLARGTPARSIAAQLSISSKTVSNYLTLLKSKLRVSSHAELVHLGIGMGVVRVVG
ncbi:MULTISPECIES: response regulator [Pseudomonas]|jgi:DNA-binding NarL/FixJ family response regulator|uniref:Response regulator transcription factor n=1 Tax=Pseudomonas azadiae TaxID=2843612 RepID=A0ABS6P3M1_9PSED|nr:MULTISPECIES: response regulator transcription factor [Pseudomonas]MBV4454834.1 response regulator transcription factor [Pseudomonas azadiae]NMF43858.1 response regulator transcription factor [Pseudomonas sp. SWRI 103]